MLRAAYCRYNLKFKTPAVTSRNVMTEKETYFLKVWNEGQPDKYGIGECSIFRGLSAEDNDDYESKLHNLCRSINNGSLVDISGLSSLKFGYETALLDFKNGCHHTPFPSKWSHGDSSIVINGLVWMGTIDEMTQRVQEKIAKGFRCLKLKIGACDFEQELELISRIRRKYDSGMLEIRLDANGAFCADDAMSKLEQMSKYDIHSIEQPIASGQWGEMAEICRKSPIAIALDEELIGVSSIDEMRKMLQEISPQYVVLKPSLCGGISGAKYWIDCANMLGIRWWVTSALESNIGLNSIAQWVSTLNVKMPQGLGTGNLYSNNIESPIEQIGEVLMYNPGKKWVIPDLRWIIPE